MSPTLWFTKAARDFLPPAHQPTWRDIVRETELSVGQTETAGELVPLRQTVEMC